MFNGKNDGLILKRGRNLVNADETQPVETETHQIMRHIDGSNSGYEQQRQDIRFAMFGWREFLTTALGLLLVRGMFTLQMGKSRPIKNVLSIRMATQPPKS
jgi:hypothetical protein